MTTHIQDIADVLEYERVSDAILVGWSYGGAVITGVAHRAPERLAHLVYLDAFVPRHGEALLDLLGPEIAAEFEERARAMGEGWRVPPRPAVPPDDRPRTDLLLPACREPLILQNPAAERLGRTYILCTENPPIPLFAHFLQAAEHARQEGWRYRELPTGHAAVWTMPRETAQLLLEVTEISETSLPIARAP
jgi:pimeloyl-ACP methyl ester carboxylesterase